MTTKDNELRDLLIDKLDDQRFGDNVVNKKLLFKDIEWIIDELLPLIESHYHSRIDSMLSRWPKEHENTNVPDENLNAQESGEVMGYNEALDTVRTILEEERRQHDPK